jgi:hypothetical protein
MDMPATPAAKASRPAAVNTPHGGFLASMVRDAIADASASPDVEYLPRLGAPWLESALPNLADMEVQQKAPFDPLKLLPKFLTCGASVMVKSLRAPLLHRIVLENSTLRATDEIGAAAVAEKMRLRYLEEDDTTPTDETSDRVRAELDSGTQIRGDLHTFATQSTSHYVCVPPCRRVTGVRNSS